jgi:pimeloyl-ACP methyl ester carboxylesterase
MSDRNHGSDRRGVLGLAAALSAGFALPAEALRRPASSTRDGEMVQPVPLPPQAPQREGLVDVPGAQLFYRDTGGAGPAILLAHPGTGSAFIWAYQQPAFVRAGYRVVAWSRRGHRGSKGDPSNTAPSPDIDALADALKIDRFHALGSAAGGGVMLDYAVARPARLRTLIIACSIGNVDDPEYRRRSAALRPDPFDKLPADVRELGPCYRAADPEGVKRWKELEEAARTARMGPPPVLGDGGARRTTWADVSALQMPILWMTGDADLFTPPPLLAEFHRRTPNSELRVIHGAGHSAYWEQPAQFNVAVLDFLKRRGRGR